MRCTRTVAAFVAASLVALGLFAAPAGADPETSRAEVATSAAQPAQPAAPAAPAAATPAALADRFAFDAGALHIPDVPFVSGGVEITGFLVLYGVNGTGEVVVGSTRYAVTVGLLCVGPVLVAACFGGIGVRDVGSGHVDSAVVVGAVEPANNKASGVTLLPGGGSYTIYDLS